MYVLVPVIPPQSGKKRPLLSTFLLHYSNEANLVVHKSLRRYNVAKQLVVYPTRFERNLQADPHFVVQIEKLKTPRLYDTYKAVGIPTLDVQIDKQIESVRVR